MTEFIKVQRILSDKEGKNSKINPETINIEDIKGFRGWFKGINDKEIAGDITILILKSKSKESKSHTILINENYDDFSIRISAKAVIK